MERIVRPIDDGGVPYLNQDFVNILQDNNLKSYRSFLDTVNDQFGNSGNSGIIIKGITITSNVFNLSNSMVYINGEFMELLPTSPTTYTPPTGASNLYLIISTLFEDREAKVTGLPVGYIRADGVTFQTDQETHTLIKYYFTITDSTPPSDQSYIQFEFINNEWVTSRYLDRVLKYHMADFGQIFMNTSAKYFEKAGTNLGFGFGPMKGFKWCNQDIGINTSGSRLLQHNQTSADLKDKFLVGFSFSTTDTPNNQQSDYPPLVENYKKIFNKGGFNELFLYSVPSHNHGTYSSFASNQLKHHHELDVQEPFKIQYVPSGIPPEDYKLPPVFAKGRKLRTWTNNVVNYQFTEPHPSRTIFDEWNPIGTTALSIGGYVIIVLRGNETGNLIDTNPPYTIRSDYMRGNFEFGMPLVKPLRYGQGGLTNFLQVGSPRTLVNLPQFAGRWAHYRPLYDINNNYIYDINDNQYFKPLVEWQRTNGPLRSAIIVYASGDGTTMTFRIRRINGPQSDPNASAQTAISPNFVFNLANYNEGTDTAFSARNGETVTLRGFGVPGYNITGKWKLGPYEQATWVGNQGGTPVSNEGIFEFTIEGTETQTLGVKLPGDTQNLPIQGYVDFIYQVNTSGGSDPDPISTHTHQVTSPDVPHNNLPPYYDVVYYEKIAV